jgi:hypothetical protein
MVLMIKAENKDNSRSVEHLIPNVALTKKRNNDQGDFYACRKCNIRKSKIDEILGLVSKGQSDDQKMAGEALVKLVDRHKKLPARFVPMIENAVTEHGGVRTTLPMSGLELIEYLTFLGKGVYFIKNERPYVRNRQVMILSLFNKHVNKTFSEGYQKQYGANPIRDLEKNPRSVVIAPGECVIWSKNNEFLIYLHDYMSIGIQIKNRNRKNSEKEKAKIEYILGSFDRK